MRVKSNPISLFYFVINLLLFKKLQYIQAIKFASISIQIHIFHAYLPDDVGAECKRMKSVVHRIKICLVNQLKIQMESSNNISIENPFLQLQFIIKSSTK